MDTDTERTAVRRQKQGVMGSEEPLEAGGGKEGAPPRAWERKRGPADTPISEFWPIQLHLDLFS